MLEGEKREKIESGRPPPVSRLLLLLYDDNDCTVYESRSSITLRFMETSTVGMGKLIIITTYHDICNSRSRDYALPLSQTQNAPWMSL